MDTAPSAASSTASSPAPAGDDDASTALAAQRALLENAIARCLQPDSSHAHLFDSQGFVKLADLIQIPGVKTVCDDEAVIAKALSESSIIEVTPEHQVRLLAKRPARTTIILREVGEDVTPEEISSLLDEKVVVSARPDVQQTWFIQLASEADAKQAVLDLANKTLRGKPVKARIKSENLSKLAAPWVPSGAPMRPSSAGPAGVAVGAAPAGGAVLPPAFYPTYAPFYPGAAPFVPATSSSSPPASASAVVSSTGAAGAPALSNGGVATASPKWKTPRASPRGGENKARQSRSGRSSGSRHQNENASSSAASAPQAAAAPEFRPTDFPTLPSQSGSSNIASNSLMMMNGGQGHGALESSNDVPMTETTNGNHAQSVATAKRRGWEQPGLALKRKDEPAAAAPSPAAVVEVDSTEAKAQPHAAPSAVSNGHSASAAAATSSAMEAASASLAAPSSSGAASPGAELSVSSGPSPPVWGAKSFAQVIKESKAVEQTTLAANASTDWRKDAATRRQKDEQTLVRRVAKE